MSEPPAPETRALTLEVELPGTPEEVTRMLSDPAELARWFAPFVDGSGQVGDLLTFGWSPEMQWSTRLEAVTPGRLVRWHDAPAEQGPAGRYPRHARRVDPDSHRRGHAAPARPVGLRPGCGLG